MDGQLHEFSDTCAASREFTSRMHQLMGADFEPDPQFLEETWRLGLPAAAESWHRRRRLRVDRECSTFDVERTRSFLHHAAWAAELSSLGATDTQPRPAQAWTPQAWRPSDRSVQRWIPHGWKPLGWAPRDDAPSAPPIAVDAHFDRACTVLGVTAGSTREQIRSAYRRKVSQCHPDRLNHATDAVRRLATEQLAELNAAYRVLCDLVPDRAA